MSRVVGKSKILSPFHKTNEALPLGTHRILVSHLFALHLLQIGTVEIDGSPEKWWCCRRKWNGDRKLIVLPKIRNEHSATQIFS